MIDLKQTSSPTTTILSLLLLCGFVPFFLWIHWNTFINPDEFESLYAAWMIAEGKFPYRDFYQIHTPLSYYFLSPLFFFFKSFAVFRAAQGLMICLYFLNAYLIYALAQRFFDSKTGQASLFLYLFNWPLFSKFAEIRPDGWVITFSNIALFFLFRKKGEASISFLASGICTAFAILSKQSGFFFLLSLSIFFLVRLGTKRRFSWETEFFGEDRFNLRNVYCYILGVLIPLTGFIVFLWMNHGLRPFLTHAVHNDFFRKFIFQDLEATHLLPWKYMHESLLMNPMPFYFSIASVILLIRDLRSDSPVLSSQIFFTALMITSIGALFLNLHPWLHEWMLPSQYMTLLGGYALIKIWQSLNKLRPSLIRQIIRITWLAALAASSLLFIKNSATALIFTSEKFFRITPPALSHQLSLVLALTSNKDKCLSLNYACLFRPSVYFYNVGNILIEALSKRTQVESILISDLQKGDIKLIVPSVQLRFMRKLKQKISQNYLRQGRFYIPGSVLALNPGDPASLEILVEGWYKTQSTSVSLFIDNQPLETDRIYLSKGFHSIHSLNYSGKITFTYDFLKNKGDSSR